MALAATSVQAKSWMVDYEQAMEKANAENKNVLLYFTGSDWCPPCMAMEKQTFSKPEFNQYAEANLVLLAVDFPEYKPLPEALLRHNLELAKKFEFQGIFPTFILANSEGQVLAKHEGYMEGGPDGFIDWLYQAKR